MGTGSPDWSGAKGQVQKSMFDRSTGPFTNGHGDFDRSIWQSPYAWPGMRGQANASSLGPIPVKTHLTRPPFEVPPL
jgi:hypothetical protein